MADAIRDRKKAAAAAAAAKKKATRSGGKKGGKKGGKGAAVEEEVAVEVPEGGGEDAVEVDAAPAEDGEEGPAEGADDSAPTAPPALSAAARGKREVAGLSDRVATGVPPPDAMKRSRDLHLSAFSLQFHGTVLIADTELKLNFGRRYGLIGPNGCGKSTFLACLGHREVPIPDHIDVFLLEREVEATDMTALEAVIHDVRAHAASLEAQAEIVLGQEGPESEVLQELYDRLDELDVETADTRAGSILHGLGFTKEMQAKKTRDFSGGWCMRIALARALFRSPDLLLLDQPTNHLDLEACVWLEEYLKNYKRILVLVSHSQDFLNSVCTNIIHLQQRKLKYYAGNYDQYVKTRAELEENQGKMYDREQEEIRHMKEYIARFGHGSAKLARQAQSKEKTLAKMIEKGLTEAVVKERQWHFRFNDPGTLPPPILQFNMVTFGYSKDKVLYRNLDFGIDLDSRVALVGPNGAGKSTLLKLMMDKLQPLDGMVQRNSHLRIAWYHQHLTDLLDVNKSAVEFMLEKFPEFTGGIEGMRSVVGRFGLTGKAQMVPISHLSDGQKSRVVFSYLTYQSPHLLLLDEPTNALDIETIDSLADAINKFEGGMVLVSHDFRLINQVAREIWVCEHGKVAKWRGDIQSYKETLKEKVLAEQRASSRA